jgi:hypothetical protein
MLAVQAVEGGTRRLSKAAMKRFFAGVGKCSTQRRRSPVFESVLKAVGLNVFQIEKDRLP